METSAVLLKTKSNLVLKDVVSPGSSSLLQSSLERMFQ